MIPEIPEFEKLFLKYRYKEHFERESGKKHQEGMYRIPLDELNLHLESIINFSYNKIRPVTVQNDLDAIKDEPLMLELAKIGAFGLTVPRQYDYKQQDTAQGLDFFVYILTLMMAGEFSGNQSVTLGWEISHVEETILLKYGSEHLKQKWLPMMSRGYNESPSLGNLCIASFGLTEPNAGSDTGGITSTMAPMSGSPLANPDEFVANGKKSTITNRADGGFTVFLLLDQEISTAEEKKYTAVAIPNNTTGHTIGKPEWTMTHRSSPTCERILEDVGFSEKDIVGERGQGRKYMLDALNDGRLGITTSVIGSLAFLLDRTIERARTRQSFGKPIIQYHGIAQSLVNIESTVLATKLMIYEGAMNADKGMLTPLYSAITKYFGTEYAFQAGHEAMQIWGAAGLMSAEGIDRFTRDAQLGTIGEGESNIMGLLAARYLQKNGRKSLQGSAVDQRLDHALSTYKDLSVQQILKAIYKSGNILDESIKEISKNEYSEEIKEKYQNRLRNMVASLESTKALLDFGLTLLENNEQEGERVFAMAQYKALQMSSVIADEGNQFLALGGQNPMYVAHSIYHTSEENLVDKIVVKYRQN